MKDEKKKLTTRNGGQCKVGNDQRRLTAPTEGWPPSS
jgi:hypothetical protein